MFEAASQTVSATEVALVSRQASSPALQEQMLSGAAARMQSSWARPALWHAGAAEALSAIYALRGNAAGGARAHYMLSMRLAHRATLIAPAQPRAWARLGEFALMGLPGVPCAAQECILNSWRAAPLLDVETDCARFRVAHASGVQEQLLSKHIDWRLRTNLGADQAARCLDFLSQEEIFQIRMLARSRR